MKVKRNDEWITWTYRQYYDDVTKAAKSMIKLGLEPLHGVGIMGFNSPEWFISFMGCIMVREDLHVVIIICSYNILMSE